MLSPTSSIQRLRLSIAGVVQGVGFRPFVHRLATSLQVSGFVRNDGGGVTIEVEGQPIALSHFIARLHAEAPTLSHIEHCTIEELRVTHESAFLIQESGASAGAVSIPPDLATCNACVRELFDPGDRRYRYPFITCTHCGPRYSIVKTLPYDRARTTMDVFPMCAECEREFRDPRDRRFRAETNACPQCGPSVHLLDAAASTVEPEPGLDVVATAAKLVLDGAILALKGIGGYHLVCRADEPKIVGGLRQQKFRDEKPFAMMVPDLRRARELVQLNEDEARLLESSASPIVLATKRVNAPVAANIAPGRSEFGIMLPYSPLHHLLIRAADFPLVMTSGNPSDTPIVTDDAEAFERLAADYFLTHNRLIHARCDDSVVRLVTVAGTPQPLMLRRSRGFVPSTLPLPLASDVLLACGAELKNTVTIASNGRALVGPHLGDLENYDTLQAFNGTIAHLGALTGAHPLHIASDEHPDYLSTKYAHNRMDLDRLPVQHHHAHLAACLAEYGQAGPAIGLILDGSGYGRDGTIWGGEVLVGDQVDFTRIGHLWPVTLPGGAAAVREPWRMACAWLAAAECAVLPPAIQENIGTEPIAAVQRLIGLPELSPITTSMGRLLDAVAAICGVRLINSYEGQAACELEAIARTGSGEAYPVPVELSRSLRKQEERVAAAAIDREPLFVLDARPFVRAVLHDVLAGRACSEIAGCAHNGVANAAITSLRIAFEQTGIHTAVLSGGVFQNVLLLERISRDLAAEGWRVLVPKLLPPNDGGISFGQAAVSAARLHRSSLLQEGLDVPGNSRPDPGRSGS